MQASDDPKQLSTRQCSLGYGAKLECSSVAIDMVNSRPLRVRLESVLITDWPQPSETDLTQCYVKWRTWIDRRISFLHSEPHAQVAR